MSVLTQLTSSAAPWFTHKENFVSPQSQSTPASHSPKLDQAVNKITTIDFKPSPKKRITGCKYSPTCAWPWKDSAKITSKGWKMWRSQSIQMDYRGNYKQIYRLSQRLPHFWNVAFRFTYKNAVKEERTSRNICFERRNDDFSPTWTMFGWRIGKRGNVAARREEVTNALGQTYNSWICLNMIHIYNKAFKNRKSNNNSSSIFSAQRFSRYKSQKMTSIIVVFMPLFSLWNITG